jgi:ABC-2 type transport system permease protein
VPAAAETTRTVFLIARRELNTRLRTRAFAVGTAVSIVVLAAFVLIQSTAFSSANTTVGLNGQAISVAEPLRAAAAQLGRDVETREITDLATGTAMVADGELDALVSGPPAGLRVLVDEELDQDLRTALDGIVARQVLESELAAVEDLDPGTVLDRISGARVDVQTLRAADPERGQRLAIALLIIALLYVSLVLYGTMLAQGVIEEKASRVVELLLSTVRPGHLLAGKVLGLGLVGLIQFAVVGVSGLLLAASTGALSLSGVAAGTLLWGLIWYLLGYFLYATVFAAVGSLVSRQEDAQAVLTPITLVLVVAFVLGFSVLADDAFSATSTVLSLLPPFAPILMPGKIALGAAATWQVLTAIALTLGAIILLTVLGGRIYRNAVLHMGTRVRLRDALR